MKTPRSSCLVACVLWSCASLAKAQVSDWAWNEPGALVQQKKDFAGAIPLFEQLTAAKRPRHPIFLAAFASALAHLGRTDEAFQRLDEMLDEGYVSTEIFLEDASSFHLDVLESDPRWGAFIERMRAHEQRAREALEPEARGVANNPALETLDSWAGDAGVDDASLLARLASWSEYPTPTTTDTWVRFWMAIEGGKRMPYYVYIPKTYTPAKPTGLLVYLRDAVWNRAQPRSESSREFEFDNNPALETVKRENLLHLYPACDKTTVWWSVPGRAMIQAEIAEVRRRFNVDDDRVWLLGVSDGATGSLTLALTQPTAFAGIGVACADWKPMSPRLGNLVCRPLVARAAENDGLYPVSVARARAAFVRERGGNVDWREMPGVEHTLALYYEKEFPGLCDALLACRRGGPPSTLEWHVSLASTTPSGCEWIRVEQVSESLAPASWHPASVIREEGNGAEEAYGPKLGAVRGRMHANTFEVETSRVTEFTILAPVGAVDFSKPIRVIVNGREAAARPAGLDREVLMSWFRAQHDRRRLVGAEIRVTVPP